MHATRGYSEQSVDEKLAWLFVKRAGQLVVPDEGSFRVTVKTGAIQALVADIKRGADHRWFVETTAPQPLAGRRLLVKGESLWAYDPMLKRSTTLSAEEASLGHSLSLIYAMDPAFWYEIEQASKDDRDVLDVRFRCRLANCHYAKARMWIAQKGSRPLRIALMPADGSEITYVFRDIQPKDLTIPRTIQRLVKDVATATITLDQIDSKKLPDVVFSKHHLSR